jgi:hypothetical protein
MATVVHIYGHFLNEYRFDFVDMPHHGSKENQPEELLNAVRADHIVVSTNGHVHGHPDLEACNALATYCTSTYQKAKLYFNFDAYRTYALNGTRKCTEYWSPRKTKIQNSPFPTVLVIIAGRVSIVPLRFFTRDLFRGARSSPERNTQKMNTVTTIQSGIPRSLPRSRLPLTKTYVNMISPVNENCDVC